ncbi:MAG TPA: FAD-binding oxidoreductase [Baekduia sp.]|nr:FAD-binding oxidoreductase [Baekduia sp.]
MLAQLGRLVGAAHAVAPEAAALRDATEAQALTGRADALVRPGTPQEVAAVVAWCYEHDVPVTPRGGGTGLAGGAVPQGGVVLALDRLDRVRSLEPGRWRMHAEAGVTTATVHRRAREVGLHFPPDPGAAEQSQLGGTIATNAGGPHAFGHGPVGRWLLGVEAVLAPGELVTVGGPVRRDVATYDLKALLCGSEGTLGIVTAAWLRLAPAPEAELPLVARYADISTGCAAVLAVYEAGLQPAVLDFIDGRTLQAAGEGGAAFAVLAAAEGGAAQARALRDELAAVLGDGALDVHVPAGAREVKDLWRWRAGLSWAAIAARGGKVSEDVAVPVEHLEAIVRGTLRIGERLGVDACSWGHAGDGNVHATFLVDRSDAAQLARAAAAAEEVVALALELGGTASGEHGIGLLKQPFVAGRTPPALVAAQRALKHALDPKGLLNPGKKVP